MALNFKLIEKKADYIRKETIRLHGLAPETRVASSLSCVELLAVLFYGKIIRTFPGNPFHEKRDRLILSKGHGSISFYPVLADLGYFKKKELERICKPGSFLGGIPDCIIPGYETTNGSLGHGPGVACGMSLALKKKKNLAKIYVILGDGELMEGSVWEAVMFAGHHKLDNLVFIVDNNSVSMLDYTKNIICMEPLAEKFSVFGFETYNVEGHDIKKLSDVFQKIKLNKTRKPKVVIANTVKGKGVERLENDSLSHIRTLSESEIKKLIAS